MTEDATVTPVELVMRGHHREVLGIEDFTEADLEDIRRAKPSKESEAFNHELGPAALRAVMARIE